MYTHYKQMPLFNYKCGRCYKTMDGTKPRLSLAAKLTDNGHAVELIDTLLCPDCLLAIVGLINQDNWTRLYKNLKSQE